MQMAELYYAVVDANDIVLCKHNTRETDWYFVLPIALDKE
jgi:hypothetical protein